MHPQSLSDKEVGQFKCVPLTWLHLIIKEH
jgi:hypothetical protein